MSKSAIPQIAIHAIRPLLDALRARGIDAAMLFAEVGLHGLPLGDPEMRLPLVCLDELWDRAAVHLGDPDLGLHLAESVGPGTFGLLSHLCSSSASLGEGLQRVFRYFRLLSEGSSYELTLRDEVATVIATQDTPAVAPVRQRVEFTVSVLCCYLRQLLASEWRLLGVFFEHAAPAELAEHRRVYGQAPRFGAPSSGFSFPRELLACPLRTSNPAVGDLLERLAVRQLAELPRTATIADALRALCLRDGFAGELTLDAAAHRLRLSPRTLQRRLREEGTSHQQIVDDTRRNLASRMLTQSGLGIAEVAFALGFSEPGGLHRAFKRWTGMTPAEYRRAAAAVTALAALDGGA